MAASWEAGLSAAAKLRRAVTAARAGTLEVEDAREALTSAKRCLNSANTDEPTTKASLDCLLACCKSARATSGLDSVLQQLTPEIAGCLPSVIIHLAAQQHQEQAVAIFIHYSRAVQSLTGVLGILSKFGFCSEEVSKNGNQCTPECIAAAFIAQILAYARNTCFILSIYRTPLYWLRCTALASCSRQLSLPALPWRWTARQWWLD